MKELFKKLRQDKITFLCFSFSTISLVFSLIFILLFFFKLPPFIPLYNRMPWGYERLGTRIHIFVPFLISLSLFVFNLFLSAYWYNKAPLLARLISITTLAVCFFTSIFLVKTITIIL